LLITSSNSTIGPERVSGKFLMIGEELELPEWIGESQLTQFQTDS
jgi:hypothetical protein